MSSVMIVDEHPIARHALRLLLEAEGLTVVAECGNGTEALELARRLRPTLMVLELAIPGLGGLETIQRVVRQASGVKVLVVTGQSSEYFAARSHEAGALGFISKQTDLQQVGVAVRALLNGHTYFPRDSVLALPNISPDQVESNPLKALSTRELTVLQMLAKGMANNTIGEQLLLSEKTISTYKARVMQKLRAGSMLELLDIARRHGLIDATPFSSEIAAPQLPDSETQRELLLLREVIDALPHAVCFRDIEGRLVTCNKQYLVQHSLTLELAVGRRIDETGELPPKQGQYAHDLLLAAMKKGEPYTLEVKISLPAGERLVRHWGKPYRDSGGNLLGLICGNVDITDLDRNLVDLRSTSNRREISVQAKEQFMQWIIDEMSSPLNRIAAMLDLSISPAEDVNKNEALDVARHATKGLQDMLGKFRDYLRLEAGKQPLSPWALNVEELTRKLVDEFRQAVAERGLTMKLDTHAALHPDVWLDPNVFSNIARAVLNNALKYTDQGNIEVSLLCLGTGQGLVQVELRVRDTGIGMDADMQSRIFEIFNHRFDDLNIRRGSNGIDLALCKLLVEQMDGKIQLTSSPGEGTSISVTLMLPAANR
ncbi:response regulator [Pseudomonas sp. ZM23]|uniref:histidine kinase n=1 Tax=Pseudomonas triclosanedens TaxID=2961893 RepID=A0ABY6ZQ28_9PSED|nr:response regulator [Pseudomonas triclosanedens]MCP8467522.1 response regulator [Pseudomonas triclosanedens]MCP8471699.1 response regulator [Pseudomonas triclosanedens]MCP8478948.1 response regulator [Pseudomonas triclosanedens]WAI47014.1 response regulator [Pseudomonas triclosanedens]